MSAITISPDVSGRKLGPRGGVRSKVWVKSLLVGIAKMRTLSPKPWLFL